MLEVVLKVFSVGGPAALALMGFVVIDKPPKSNRARAIWYTAFSVLAFLSVVAAIFYSGRTRRTNSGDDFRGRR